MLTLQVFRGGRMLEEESHPRHVQLYFKKRYPKEAVIRLTAPAGQVWLQIDHCFQPALIYLPTGQFDYRLPRDDEPGIHPPYAFQGVKHLIRAWLPTDAELSARRNLALNPLDQKGESSAYPRATANVETRNEAQFAARNVIDGFTKSDAHGHWPYQSWGIWERADAWLKVDFGREVKVDELALVLRADFPHDAYWTDATVVFSDGHEMALKLRKSGEPQHFAFEARRISWMRLERLIKSDDPSVFPALTQWEIYGTEAG